MPLVVVVVVTHDPGDWFDQTLESLASQDYPNLRVVVFDTGREIAVASSPGDTDAGTVTKAAEQVRRILPEAEIHRLPRKVGYGEAANEVLRGGCAEATGSEAGFFLFCHDDVALEPTTVRALVEKAWLCDAGVVGPKLVDWDDPRWLLQMGETVDRTAAAVPLVERGEADQGQHDGLREVFAVPGAVTLVQAALFKRVGGFDEAITWLGDDLSLCWRARLAGSRVVVTSATRVRHREALADRVPERLRRRLAVRHQVRILLTCTSRGSRRIAVPVLLLLSLLRSVGELLTGSAGGAWAQLAAWPWNLVRRRSLWIARRQVKSFRRADDRHLHRLQVPRSVRATWARRRNSSAAADLRARSVRPKLALASWTTTSALLAVVLGGMLLMGSRHLLTRGVPHIGQFVAFDSPDGLYQEWRTGWRRTGLGSTDTPVPSLPAALAGLGTLVGGHMALLRTLLTAGLLPLGVVGAFMSLRSLRTREGLAGSPWAALGAAVAYAALPIPYTALSSGRWDTLAVYAAVPWLLTRLAAAGCSDTGRQDALPGPGGQAGRQERSGWPRHVLVLGLVTAALAMLVPAAPILMLLLAVGLALGGLLAFEPSTIGRLLGGAVGGGLVAAVLHLPWTVAGARSWGDTSAWSDWWGLGPHAGLDEGVPLSLDSAPALWALLGAATLPLLVGRSWRSSWAVRGWTLAVGVYALVWARHREVGGLGELPLPRPDLMLVLAGAGVALAVGCGIAAIEHDVAGRSRRLGLGRMAAALAVVALVGATGPVVAGSVDGYWGAPREDFNRLLAGVDDDVSEPASRVLWISHPDVFPGDGWPMDSGLTYATTLQAHPTALEILPGPAGPATGQLAAAIEDARSGETARLGRVLAPMAVQYLAVPLGLAPSVDQHTTPPPDDLLEGLANQLDLQRVSVDPSIVVYRNLAFPLEPDNNRSAGRHSRAAIADFEDFLPGDTVLFQSVAGSGRWNLVVDGVEVERQTALGWANSFVVAAPGRAELRYETPLQYQVLLVVQAAAWLIALVLLVWLRGRERSAAGGAPSRKPDEVAPSQWITLPQEDHEYVKVLAKDDIESREPADPSAEKVGV